MEVKLAIVGSQSFSYNLWKEEARVIIHDTIEKYAPSLIISGGAIGIDMLAESIADELKILKKIYSPIENRWEPDGYKARNYLIAGACTHLLCIRSKTSTTYGSGWTCDRAEEMGKTVMRYYL